MTTTSTTDEDRYQEEIEQANSEHGEKCLKDLQDSLEEAQYQNLKEEFEPED